MQLSGLLARLTTDERSTLLERRLGPNAVALDDRALADQLAQPHALTAALTQLNTAQLLLLRWLAMRPGLQATWMELLDVLGDRLTPDLLDRYLHDLRLWGVADYDPRPQAGFFATYPAVASRLPAGRGVQLEPRLSELTSDVLYQVCYALKLVNPPKRKDARIGIVMRTLTEPESCRGAVARLSDAARALFEWLREQGGSVSASVMNKRAPARNRGYGSEYGSVASFWRPVPKGETIHPLAELVCAMLVVPVMPYPGAWYAPSSYAIATEVEAAYSGRSLFDTAPLQPPPLERGEQVDGIVPNPGNVMRDLGHLLGFLAAGRCEWRQDGLPYKRSLVALGKALGYRDGVYAESLWDLAASAGLVRPARSGALRYEPVAVGDLSSPVLFGGLLFAWVKAGALSVAPGVSSFAGQTARARLIELLQLIPADTWISRSSLEAWLRFHWPTLFAPEYQPIGVVTPDPGWTSLGSLILAHGSTSAGQAAVMLPAGHQRLIQLEPPPIAPEDTPTDDGVLPPWDSSWIVQPDRTIVVPPNAHVDVISELWKVATLESNQGASVFRVTAQSIAAALNRSMTPAEIRTLLQRGSRVPLPPTVERLIEDQGQRWGRIKVGTAKTYVKTDDPALLEELRRDKKLSKLDWRDVAPGIAFVVSADPISVLDSLRQAGYLPVIEQDKKLTPAAPTPILPTPRRRKSDDGVRGSADGERQALLRVLNAAVRDELSILASWVDRGTFHTAELEVVDLHEDELHAYDLEDNGREVFVPFDGILELKTASHLFGDPVDDEEL